MATIWAPVSLSLDFCHPYNLHHRFTQCDQAGEDENITSAQPAVIEGGFSWQLLIILGFTLAVSPQI